MKTIKLTVDVDNNIAYMYLDESKKNFISKTIELGEMNLDLSEEGEIIGIEFLNAKKQFKSNKKKFIYQNIKTMPKPIEYQLT